MSRHISNFERFLSSNKWSFFEVSKVLTNKLISEYRDNFIVYGKLLAGIDTTFVMKSSKQMLGIQKWHNHSGNANQPEMIIGHNWGLAGLIGRFGSRFFCWPILTRLMSGQKNPVHYVGSTEENLKPTTFIESLLALAFQTSDLLESPFRVVADAYFAKGSFIKPLVDKGIDVVTRWRKDGVGFERPGEYCGRGRPRKYGKKWKLVDLIKVFPLEEIKLHLYGKNCAIEAVSRDLFLRGLEKKVRIVVVKGKNGPVIFVCTDLSLGIKEIVEIYGSRFQIEITIRELKQYFGFGDYQMTNSLSILRYSILSCVAHCLSRFVLLSQKEGDWLNNPETKAIKESKFSFARLRRSLKTYVIEQSLLTTSAVTAEIKKNNSDHELISKIVA